MSLIKTRTSGISKALPKVLPYPPLLPLANSLSLIKNRMVYVIRHYGLTGISILVSHRGDEVVVLCGDWYGNTIDLSIKDGPFVTICLKFLNDGISAILNTMSVIKLRQAQYFFAIDDNDNLVLVDVQTSINKFASPGMLREIFSKSCPIQTAVKVEIFDERVLESVTDGIGSYGGDLIIKPSNFVLCSIQDKETPLYLEVRR